MNKREGLTPRRVSDVVPLRDPLDGEQAQVRELVGKEFVITQIREWEGDQGPYLAVQIEIQGKVYFFFSSHQAVMQKLLKCQGELPLLATVTKHTAKESGRDYFDIG